MQSKTLQPNQSARHVLLISASSYSVTKQLILLVLARNHRCSFIDHVVNFNKKPATFDVENSLANYIAVEGYDRDATEAAVYAINCRDPIDFVLTTNDLVIEHVSELALLFGLKSTSAMAIARAKDKQLLHQILHDAGLNALRSFSLVEARERGDLVYPVVVKPRRGAASLNVKIVNTRAEIQAFDTAELDTHALVLAGGVSEELIVEEYAEGVLISAECVAFRGEVRVLTLSARQRADTSEVVELGSIIPAPVSTENERTLITYVTDICQEIGFDRGICHIEVILTENGPFLVDFNARMPGVNIPALYQEAYGSSMFELAVAAYLDEPLPTLAPKSAKVAMNRLLGLKRRCTVPADVDLTWLDEYVSYSASITLVRSGDQPATSDNMGYIGEITLVAPSAGIACAVMDEVSSRLERVLGVDLLAWNERDRTQYKKLLLPMLPDLT